mmetsp:Transcript_32141/g.44825  ORF Transcript_32141/g.44825 Transcript_32141/m.44825 type:complete len:207 (+) Transcript_32141:474-1094(+)
MYRAGGNLEATSIWRGVAKSIKSGLGSTLEAHMERAKAHIMINYVVIPASMLIILYIVYRMITTDELVSNKEGSCPLGYTNEDLPAQDVMKQAEATRPKPPCGTSPFVYAVEDGLDVDEDVEELEQRKKMIGASSKAGAADGRTKDSPPPLPPYPKNCFSKKRVAKGYGSNTSHDNKEDDGHGLRKRGRFHFLGEVPEALKTATFK